jgi:hypothetical protein
VLFDRNGYILFATEQEYLSAPMSIGKQISVPMPGISALPGYIRCHDTTVDTIPPHDDLAIVCSNCHRMLHRRPWHTIHQLKVLVENEGAGNGPETGTGALTDVSSHRPGREEPLT